MRIAIFSLIIGFVFFSSGCEEAKSPAQIDEISQVSLVLGDASWFAKTGRLPRDGDDSLLRIQTHLLYAESLLRERRHDELSPQQRENRRARLDDLHKYALSGRFPQGEGISNFLPTFVDDEGTHCAVAHLARESGDSDLVASVNQKYRNDFIVEMEHGGLAAWAQENGFSMDEVALIQPTYPPRQRDTRWQLQLKSEHQIGDGETQLKAQSGVELSYQYRLFSQLLRAKIALGGDAFVGANDDTETVYRAQGWFGWHEGFRVPRSIINGKEESSIAVGHHTMGVRGGVGVENPGADFGTTLLLPIEAYYHFPTSENTRLIARGGVLARRNSENTKLGYRGHLGLRWKRLLKGHDVFAGANFESRSIANFLGASIGLGHYREDGWWITD